MNCSCCSLPKSDTSELLLSLFKKRDMSDLLMICFFTLKKQAIHSKNSYFSPCFWQVFIAFFSLYAQERITPITLCSGALFSRGMGEIHSHRSLQKSNRELFTPLALYKRATGGICSFPRANHYFALSLTKNEQFSRKTKERICNPEENLMAQSQMYFISSLLFIEAPWEECKEKYYIS